MARAKGTGQLFDQVQHALNGENQATGTSRCDQGAPLILESGPQLTIETIGDFAAKVRAALDETNSVAICFPAEIQLDITALQLFCSACQTADAAGKSFTFLGELPEALHRLAAESGAARHEKCVVDSITCFRKNGGSSPCPR